MLDFFSPAVIMNEGLSLSTEALMTFIALYPLYCPNYFRCYHILLIGRVRDFVQILAANGKQSYVRLLPTAEAL